MSKTKKTAEQNEIEAATAALPEERRAPLAQFPEMVTDLVHAAPPPRPLRPFSMAEYRAANGDFGKPPTRWRNDLLVPQKLELHYLVNGPTGAPVEVVRLVELAPGAEIELPGVFDRAIRVVHAGVCVGGLAPGLTSLSHSPVPLCPELHEALEPFMAPRAP